MLILMLSTHHHHIQFQSGSFFVTKGGWIHLILSAIALTSSLHLFRSAASSVFNPTFFTLSSTCLLHVIFGHLRFRCPFTSSIIAFFSILSSYLLITCSCHLTQFAIASFYPTFPSCPTSSSDTPSSFYLLI